MRQRKPEIGNFSMQQLRDSDQNAANPGGKNSHHSSLENFFGGTPTQLTARK